MYRRDLLWHLREHHRKTGYSDEMMLREMVKWPKDLRKVVCIKCTESEANENSTWLCCDPNEVYIIFYVELYIVVKIVFLRSKTTESPKSGL